MGVPFPLDSEFVTVLFGSHDPYTRMPTFFLRRSSRFIVRKAAAIPSVQHPKLQSGS